MIQCPKGTFCEERTGFCCGIDSASKPIFISNNQVENIMTGVHNSQIINCLDQAEITDIRYITKKQNT